MRNAWMMGFLMMTVACGGSETAKVINTDKQRVDTGELDETGPVIEHTPITTSQQYEQAVALSATVADAASGVQSVSGFYKRADEVTWSSVSLSPTGDLWQGAIPGTDVTGSGMNYYIEAVDIAGNTSAYPINGAADALYFRVSAD
ncbi:MAG: hypothetical protein VX000_00615 [Myxococcota bacterium]|nr:hypothetical protein [Myxococcota bacterium]